MECTNYHILITGYIDHELSDDEMHQLKTHLQTCEHCVTHLHKMERIRTALNRFQLVQDIPEASPHFARKISRILQETTIAQPRQAFVGRAALRYRTFVLRLVERWIGSLRARPVTWVTSVSCALILMAGVVFSNITHTLDQPPRYALIQPNPTVSTGDRQSVTPADVPADRQRPPAAAPIFETAVEDDAANPESAGLPDFIRFSDEPVVHIAKTVSKPVGSYVYAHIVEASQEQFLDNAVFAGYVQDARFQ